MLPLLSPPEVNLRRKQDTDDVRIRGKETNKYPPKHRPQTPQLFETQDHFRLGQASFSEKGKHTAFIDQDLSPEA